MNKKLNKKMKSAPLKGSNLWGMLIFAILLLVDMLTKAFADAYFSNPDAPESIDVIPGWIHLCITYNRGIAYGLGTNSPTWAKLAVVFGTGVLMLALAVLYFKVDKRRVWLRTAIVFIVAGGLGNFIDRVYYQVWDVNTLLGVRDMVDLSRFGFAVCNFADFFICGGAAMLVLALLFFDKDALFPTETYKKMSEEKDAAELPSEGNAGTIENNG
jgi:signal peptidase II